MRKIGINHTQIIRSFRKTAHLTLPLALFILGATVLYSAPPASKYEAGETLDPTCGPGDVNCSVEIGSSNWEVDGLDIYYNAGNVGMGTGNPNTRLDINGAFSVRGIGAPALSVAGQGRIYFDSTANKFKVSENGGPYYNLIDPDGEDWPVFQIGGGEDTLWSLHANGEDIYYDSGFVGVNTDQPEYQFESTSNTIAARFRGVAGVMPDAWNFESTDRNGDYQLSLGNLSSTCEIGGVTFNNDGTKMFIAGHCYDYIIVNNSLDTDNTNDRLAYAGESSPDSPLSVHEYDLSTPWDINTATDSGLSYDPTDDTVNRHPLDVIFTPDGQTMFVLVDEIQNPTSGAAIVEYSLATPWSMALGNVTYVQEKVLDGGNQIGGMGVPIFPNFQFNNDGTQLFLSGYMTFGPFSFDYANIWAYDLTTPYDIDTIDEISTVTLNLDDYAPIDTYFSGAFAFDPAGDKLFLVYRDFDEEYYVLNKLNLDTVWDIEFGAGNPTSTVTYSLLNTEAEGYSNIALQPDGNGFYVTYTNLGPEGGVGVGGVYQHVLIPGTEGGDVIVDGDLGVGTSSPTSRLTVVGNSDLNGNVNVAGNINLSDTSLEVALGTLSGLFIVAEDESGIIISGPGSRMFFDPTISALRAGYADGTEWDLNNVGEYSVAFGDSTIASGFRSTAFGNNTVASGSRSAAFGQGSEATGATSTAFGGYTFASGFLSTAFGAETAATASYSTAFGRLTEASGQYSTAFGRNTSALGNQSTAFGWFSDASGIVSTAFGYETQAIGGESTAFGSLSEASGAASTAFGSTTVASGDYSTAFGQETTAGGEGSTAFGVYTQANGYASFASGYNTIATGNYASALGYNTTAQAFGSVVLGQLNVVSGNPTQWIESDPLFAIGNGDYNFGVPSNALTVLKNGNVGIGVVAPDYTLDVEGDINFTGNLYKDGVLFSSASGSDTSLWTLNAEGNAIYNNGGKVGINMLDPEYQLDVVSDTIAARFRSSSAPWDLTTLSFDTLYESHPASNCFVGGGEFNPEGTKVFIVEDCDGEGGEQEVQEHVLGTAWDITTATNSGNLLDLSLDLSDSVVDIAFSSAGTKMFALTFDSINERAEVHQYGLLTPWEIDTAVYSKSQFLESALETMDSVNTISFSSDGSKLFIFAQMDDLAIPFFETNAHIVEYTLSTPWDVAALSETDSEPFSAYSAPFITAPLLFTFSSNGEKLFVGSIDVNGGDMSYETIIREYNLSTPWSLNSFTPGTEATIESGPNVSLSTPYTALYFRSDGLRGYATQFGVGGAVDGGINQYSLSGGSTGGNVIVDGDLAVGNTSASYKLHVTSTGSGSVAGFTNTNGTCTIDPNTSSLSCSSDSRLKTEILSIKGQIDSGSSLSRLSELNPVSYRWTNEEGTSAPMRYGLIAQEVREIFPELVSEGPLLDPNDPSKGNTLSVSYGGFTPFMIDAISELNDKVDFISSLSLDSSDLGVEMGGSLPEIVIRSLKNSIVTAREFIADKVRTRELCLEDGSGETCIDRKTLDRLLRGEKVNHSEDVIDETAAPDNEEDATGAESDDLGEEGQNENDDSADEEPAEIVEEDVSADIDEEAEAEEGTVSETNVETLGAEVEINE